MQINEDDFEDEEQFAQEYNLINPKKGGITPKLDLTKLKEFQN